MTTPGATVESTQAIPARTGHGAWPRVTLGVLAWAALYALVEPLSRWIAHGRLGLPRGSHLGEAVAFFFYDVPKILLLSPG